MCAVFFHLVFTAYCLFLGNNTLLMIVRALLYIIASILVVGWVLAVFIWRVNHFIHILLVVAVAFFLLGIFRKEGIE
jgi:Family of unknown function (DUF5670)